MKKQAYDPAQVGALLGQGSAESLTSRMKTEKPPVAKEQLSIRLSSEVIHALYLHQAEVRKAGANRRESTIGGVIDSLLRDALGLAQAK